MGGTDQLFNLLAGRDLMDKMGMEPQVALTMPLLEGTDGVRKMSKSYGNYVGLTDEPADMYGKVMSIPDTMIGKYYRLASTLSVDEVDAIDAALADGSADPYKLKQELARNICALYHGAGSGDAAQEEFLHVHRNREIPEDVPEVAVEIAPGDDGLVYLPRVLVAAGLSSSASQGRRDIDGGGVKVDGKAVAAKTYNVDPALLGKGAVLQVGKRHFVKLT